MKVDRHVKIAELIGKYAYRDAGRTGGSVECGRISGNAGNGFQRYRDMKLMKVPTQEGRQKYSMMHVTGDDGID